MNKAFGAFVVAVAMPLAGQWLNYPTPGIPRLPDGSANLSAKAPELADGTPDLSGVWAAKCGSMTAAVVSFKATTSTSPRICPPKLSG